MISGENFLGNKKAVSYLNKSLEKGFISHAYLFNGPRHIGKTTLALYFASELLNDDARQVMQNPDLLFVTPNEDEKQISVEAIRNLQKDLSLYPYKSKYKIAIIGNAELMNKAAANALLKTLEEPGETSVLILVSSESNKILDTIKSRCQIINLSSVPEKIIEEFLMKKNNDKSIIKDAVEFSQGRAGMAIELCNNEGYLQTMKAREKQIIGFFDADDNFKKLENAAEICSLDSEEISKVLDVWTMVLRSELLKSVEKKDIVRCKKIKNAIEKIASIEEDILEKNVNVRLAIENLCLGF